MTQPDEAAEMRKVIRNWMDLNNNPATGGFEQSFIDALVENTAKGVEIHMAAAQARSRQQLIRQIREATPSRRRMMTGAGDVTARINEARKNQNEIIDALDAVLRKLSKETT